MATTMDTLGLLAGWLVGRRWRGPSPARGASLDSTGGFEAIVVAGCRVRPDGAPSAALARRTERAVELWRRGLAPVIVLTGGPRDGRPAEARVAADLAMGLGVPAAALRLEQRSTSTDENARFARAMLRGGPVIVVTDAFHALRCERVFGRRFERVVAVSPVAAPPASARDLVREVVSLVAYGVTGRL
jgi:uncharacterized SAM-binding protein YcdF (DUF218 family)